MIPVNFTATLVIIQFQRSSNLSLFRACLLACSTDDIREGRFSYLDTWIPHLPVRESEEGAEAGVRMQPGITCA